MTLWPQAEEGDVVAHVDETEVKVEETDDVLGPVGSSWMGSPFYIFWMIGSFLLRSDR